MKLSRREKYNKINEILENITRIDKVYCYACLSYNFKVIEFNKCKNPEHHKRSINTYILKYCDKENKLTCHTLNNACKSCLGKKYGLGNKEIHAKTIKSQLENGTFNMLDPDVQKNKSSNSNLIKPTIKYCHYCNKETWHLGFRCSVCNPWGSAAGNKNCLNNLQLHPENLNHNYIYSRDDNGRIIKVNDTPFGEYCNKYIISNSLNFDDFKSIEFDESKLYPGYPTLAWEQLLDDVCEYPWLVYIKYYLDNEGNSKPLVVGKSGTLSVNSSGTDIVFDVRDNDIRAARQFLIENNYKWDKSHIDFKCFKTEKEAFAYEAKLLKETKLFGA